MKYGLIGEKLGHSFSADIHSMLGDYEYSLCPMPPEALGEFMEARDFCGINVTIPYKQEVIHYLDEIDPSAAAIGAVNTVVNRGGRLIGYNTDFYGMCCLVKRIGIDMRGKTVAILGTGGTSKTAAAVAEHLGATQVVKVSRNPDGQDEISYQQLYEAADSVNVIINTTPVGMYPNITSSPIELDRFTSLCGVVDTVYNPLCTELVLLAKERGISAEGGLYMLVAQAARAAAHFFEDDCFLEKIDEIFTKLYFDKLNIVLTGMPGSGKSTIGKRLSQMLDREVFDIDVVVADRVGMSLPEHFAKYGEQPFRELESQAIDDLAGYSGRIISTGGGSILRAYNVHALRRNGIIAFLDRPLEDITPTEDRPLSRDREALKKRYDERYHIYCATADVAINVNGGIDQTAEAVIKAIMEKIV